MNGDFYIREKQRLWALRKNLKLVGSQGERGRKVYAPTLNENLFEALSDAARQQLGDGDGGELGGGNGIPGKMQAVHSSSALGLNVFQYWQSNGQLSAIAKACNLPTNQLDRMCFECKWEITPKFRFKPNIDVVLFYKGRGTVRVGAIECKFNEAYCNRKHNGLDPKYLQLGDGCWDDIPALKEFATSISPQDETFQHLHPAQLIKHILGLKRACGKSGFILMYLWYDVLGGEGTNHAAEIEAFAKVTRADDVAFQAMTYQSLMLRLAEQTREQHTAYVDYVTERYL